MGRACCCQGSSSKPHGTTKLALRMLPHKGLRVVDILMGSGLLSACALPGSLSSRPAGPLLSPFMGPPCEAAAFAFLPWLGAPVCTLFAPAGHRDAV